MERRTGFESTRGMLGQATALLQSPARRWLQRIWGIADVNERQKWKALWPSLASLPDRPLRLLDAGCGKGRWSLELAARRPAWQILGIDRDPGSIAAARDAARRLGSDGATFLESDFLTFRPSERFDVVLSVHSAHYLAAEGAGPDLFRQFASWLKPRGVLLLLAPRRGTEIPEFSLLPRLKNWNVFGYDELRVWSNERGLVPESLTPSIGRLGTLAKQISQFGSGSTSLRLASYPVQLALDALDGVSRLSKDEPSAAWLLTARRAPEAREKE